MKKRIFAAIMSLLLLITTFSGCANAEHANFGDDITRGEWITMLAETLGMDNYQNTQAVYKDVQTDNEIFDYVQACSEWGVLRDVYYRFYPDIMADAKFVVSTAVYAMDVDLTSCEGTTDIEKATAYAVSNGLTSEATLQKTHLSQEECEAILQNLRVLVASILPEEYVDIEYKDDVKTLSSNALVSQTSTGCYQVSGFTPKVGEIYVFPATVENPAGVAVRITEVNNNGDGTIEVQTETPELSEVVDHLTYTGVVVPTADNIVLEEGVELISYSSGNTTTDANYEEDSEGVSTTIARTTKQNSNENVVETGQEYYYENSFEFSISLPKGKVEVKKTADYSDVITVEKAMTMFEGGEDEWSKESETSLQMEKLMTEWETFEDEWNLSKDEYLKDPDIAKKYEELKEKSKEYEEKYNKAKVKEANNALKKVQYELGAEIIGSLTLKGLKVAVEMDYDSIFDIKKTSVKVECTAIPKLEIKGKVELSCPITTYYIPIALTGAVLEIEVMLHANLNGEASISYEVKQTTGFIWENKKFKTIESSKTETSKFEINVNGEVKPGLDVAVSVLGIKFLDVELTIGFLVEIEYSNEDKVQFDFVDDTVIYNHVKSWKFTGHLYIPIITLTISKDPESLSSKIGLKATFNITTKDRWSFDITLWDLGDSKSYPMKYEFPNITGDDQSAIESMIEEDVEQQESINYIKSNLKINAYVIYLKEGDYTEVIEVSMPKRSALGESDESSESSESDESDESEKKKYADLSAFDYGLRNVDGVPVAFVGEPVVSEDGSKVTFRIKSKSIGETQFYIESKDYETESGVEGKKYQAYCTIYVISNSAEEGNETQNDQ